MIGYKKRKLRIKKEKRGKHYVRINKRKYLLQEEQLNNLLNSHVKLVDKKKHKESKPEKNNINLEEIQSLEEQLKSLQGQYQDKKESPYPLTEEEELQELTNLQFQPVTLQNMYRPQPDQSEIAREQADLQIKELEDNLTDQANKNIKKINKNIDKETVENEKQINKLEDVIKSFSDYQPKPKRFVEKFGAVTDFEEKRRQREIYEESEYGEKERKLREEEADNEDDREEQEQEEEETQSDVGPKRRQSNFPDSDKLTPISDEENLLNLSNQIGQIAEDQERFENEIFTYKNMSEGGLEEYLSPIEEEQEELTEISQKVKKQSIKEIIQMQEEIPNDTNSANAEMLKSISKNELKKMTMQEIEDVKYKLQTIEYGNIDYSNIEEEPEVRNKKIDRILELQLLTSPDSGDKSIEILRSMGKDNIDKLSMEELEETENKLNQFYKGESQEQIDKTKRDISNLEIKIEDWIVQSGKRGEHGKFLSDMIKDELMLIKTKNQPISHGELLEMYMKLMDFWDKYMKPDNSMEGENKRKCNNDTDDDDTDISASSNDHDIEHVDGLNTDQINSMINKFIKNDSTEYKYIGCFGKAQPELYDAINEYRSEMMDDNDFHVCWVENNEPISQKGEHWESCVLNNNTLNLFDSEKVDQSFIEAAKKIIKEFDSDYLVKLKYNTNEVQSYNNNSCGLYSIYFIMRYIMSNGNYEYASMRDENIKSSEKDIQTIFLDY